MAVHDEFVRDRAVAVKLDFHEILSGCQTRHIHPLQVPIISFLRKDNLAISIIDPDLPYILALDIEDCAGRVRENLHAGQVAVVDTDRDCQMQRHHGVAAINRLQRLGVVSRFAVGLRIPFIAGVGGSDGKVGSG